VTDASLLGPGAITLTDRQATLAEFADYLRTTNNRDGRPYEEKSKLNAAKARKRAAGGTRQIDP
jgi:hypothetical protein